MKKMTRLFTIYTLLLQTMTVSEYRLSLQIVQKYGIVCMMKIRIQTFSFYVFSPFFLCSATYISIEPQLGSAFQKLNEFNSVEFLKFSRYIRHIDIRGVSRIGYRSYRDNIYKRNNSLEFLTEDLQRYD